MIWSVSTLVRRRGMPIPVWVWKASIVVSVGIVCGKSEQEMGGSGMRPAAGRVDFSDPGGRRLEIGRRGQGAAHRGRRGDQRRDEMRAPALALPALEVAVGGGRAA